MTRHDHDQSKEDDWCCDRGRFALPPFKWAYVSMSRDHFTPESRNFAKWASNSEGRAHRRASNT